MRDGLFKKYFTIFLVTLLSCTGLLGFTLLAISGANYTSEKEKTMSALASRYGELASGVLDPQTRLQSESELTQSAGQAEPAIVCVTDEQGEILYKSDESLVFSLKDFRKSIGTIRKSGRSFSAEYISGLFLSKGNYVYGVPVRSGSGETGYLFLFTSVGPLFSYLGETMATYAFSVGIMFLVAFVVIYTTTMQLISPLHGLAVGV